MLSLLNVPGFLGTNASMLSDISLILCVISLVLFILGLVAIVLSRSTWGFAAARLLSGLGVGMLMPSYNSLISKVVPEDKRGLAFGFFGTSLGIISLPMPWIGAQLWERFTPQTPFWVTAIACILIIPIVWFKFVLPKGKPAAESGDEPG